MQSTWLWRRYTMHSTLKTFCSVLDYEDVMESTWLWWWLQLRCWKFQSYHRQHFFPELHSLDNHTMYRQCLCLQYSVEICLFPYWQPCYQGFLVSHLFLLRFLYDPQVTKLSIQASGLHQCCQDNNNTDPIMLRVYHLSLWTIPLDCPQHLPHHGGVRWISNLVSLPQPSGLTCISSINHLLTV